MDDYRFSAKRPPSGKPAVPNRETEVLWMDPATDSLGGVGHLVKSKEWSGFAEREVAPLKGDGLELIQATEMD